MDEYIRCGVYFIKNIVNNKVYIGCSINIKNRFKKHKTELNTKVHGNKSLIEDWHAYGKDAFIFELIEECEEKSMTEREAYYMSEYNSLDSNFGYNMTVRNNNFSVSCSNEYREAQSKRMKGKCPSNLASAQELRRKSVNFYIEGKFIKTFESLRAAEKELDLGKGTVHKYLKRGVEVGRGKLKNYHFEYKNK